MKVKEIAFVCYPITDVEKAKKFYEEILGLKPATKWESETFAFIEYEIGPHVLAIGKGSTMFTPGKQGPGAALEMENFDEAIDELKKAGVKFLMEPANTPVCHMAMIEDPDGNQIMIHKRHEK